MRRQQIETEWVVRRALGVVPRGHSAVPTVRNVGKLAFGSMLTLENRTSRAENCRSKLARWRSGKRVYQDVPRRRSYWQHGFDERLGVFRHHGDGQTPLVHQRHSNKPHQSSKFLDDQLELRAKVRCRVKMHVRQMDTAKTETNDAYQRQVVFIEAYVSLLAVLSFRNIRRCIPSRNSRLVATQTAGMAFARA